VWLLVTQTSSAPYVAERSSRSRLTRSDVILSGAKDLVLISRSFAPLRMTSGCWHSGERLGKGTLYFRVAESKGIVPTLSE
jgi:hypothetical protein